MKSLKNLIRLSQQVKIYIPSTINVVEDTDTQKQVSECLATLSDYFGGATSYQGLGAWITNESKLVTEKVTICQSFCNEASLKAHIESIYNYCLAIKKELGQEAIALEINNILHFV